MRNSIRYQIVHLYCRKQIKEILRLVTFDPAGGICCSPPIFRALFHGRAVDGFAVKRDIQSLSDEFNSVLTDSLVEIRIYLLWKTFMPQDLNEPRQGSWLNLFRSVALTKLRRRVRGRSVGNGGD